MTTIADRMGIPIHQSPLRFKIQRLMRNYKAAEELTLEDWLVDLANHRGATVVFRQNAAMIEGLFPNREELSDEEMVVALCQLNCADRPQLLRLPAQLISRNNLDVPALLRHATMERASRILKEIAEQALKVEPQHPAWRFIGQALQNEKRFAEPLIHWTRLAEPQFASRSTKPIGWKLVA